MAFENGLQSALMAPTEILATQHFIGLSEMLEGSSIRLALLTGSTPKSERKELFRLLKMNEIHFLIGTHALIEDAVTFDNLGMVIIDEQHRFGVAQRARLQDKNTTKPHILVMTATPIPRTLAMSVYGDLDHSVIDEMPAGRKTIKTIHRYGFTRHKIWDYLKIEIEKGRQAYIVYPLIEESDTLPYRDLMNGFNDLLDYFPRPKYQVEMMHGQMKPHDKEEIMRRFKDGKIHILVSTTVIEVGINVPNASMMIVESAEKFGLSQLHQLRGRVGRGSEQSFCILLSHKQLNENAKIRMQAMVDHSSGFELSEIDMKLRGFGDIAGTRQSGLDQLKLASLATDGEIVSQTQNALLDIFSEDPDLQLPKYEKLKKQWKKINGNKEWSTVA
jgi:ATP-dependent DNA helicase RecG